MAASREGLPYGSRWGFRTPSPDFARTAVEPLSPPAAATPTFAARSFSFPNANHASPPPPYSSYGLQYPADSRSSHDPEPAFYHPSPRAPSPAPHPYSHSYGFVPSIHKQPPKAAQNPLDALADIALMHGAGRLQSGPTYNPSPLPFPTMASPSPPVAAAVMTSPNPSWQRPDSALPPTMPTSRISMERMIPHAKPGRELNFGPIGQERRASNGPERRNSTVADTSLSPPSPTAMRLPPMKSELPLPDLTRAVMGPLLGIEPLPARPLLPAAMISESALPAEEQPLQPEQKPEEQRLYYPRISASPADVHTDSPKDVEGGREHSIVRHPVGVSKSVVQHPETPADGFLGVNGGKPAATSLPTPTQDDHVIGGLPEQVVEEEDEVLRANEPTANLTPDIAESHTGAFSVAENMAAVNTGARELMEVDDKMATGSPIADATCGFSSNKMGYVLKF